MLPQLGWLIARFRTADGPGWTAPGAAEMQEHFAPELLAVRPVPELVAVIASAPPALLVNPVAVPVKILAFVIWLFGLIAVVRLWQAASSAYFKAGR